MMMTHESSEEKEATPAEEEPQITLAEFLESVPPGQRKLVEVLGERDGPAWYLCRPELQLHCGECGGIRTFRSYKPILLGKIDRKWDYKYASYVCSNCQKSSKTYSLAVLLRLRGNGACFKFGEMPNFGPPTPSRLISLLGPDRDLFLQGRRCENQGLGIGAFVYYRRVIENQKNRIFDEVLRVAKKIGSPPDLIEKLKLARNEHQFSKSLDLAKGAMPQSLLINGHNPFTLLHSALSDGLHDKDDESCLETAQAVRIVLAELSEKLGHALKDESELNVALSHLMKAKKA